MFAPARIGPLSRWLSGVPIVLSFLAATALPVSATLQYVDASAPGPTHDGSSWATAFTAIQPALDAASTDQVWVAKGAYAGGIVVSTGVSLYGGFAGTETDLTQRNVTQNRTVLLADDGSAAVTTTAVLPIRVDGFTVRAEHALNASGLILGGSNATVANCTLFGLSAGISSSTTASTVIDSRFIGCDAGVEVVGGTLTLSSCLATACRTAVSYVGSPTVKVYNNTILNNGVGVANCQALYNNIIAWNGTGVAAYTGTPTSNCIYANGSDWGSSVSKTGLNGNFSGDPRLAAAGSGDLRVLPGSPCVDKGDRTISLLTTLDVDGQPRVQGAGVDIGGYESNGQTPSVTSLFLHVSPSGNDANTGATWSTAKRTLQGAIDAAWGSRSEIWVKSGTYAGPTTVYSSVGLYGGFAGDEALRLQRHGAASVVLGEPAWATLDVRSNASPATVDGFEIRGGAQGIACVLGATTVSNCTVSGCVDGVAVADGAPFIVNDTMCQNARGISLYGGTASLANTIAAFNGSGLFNYPDVTASVSLVSNCVFGNALDYDGLADATGDNGNIKADPLLASNRLGNFHIQPGSPCIDAGDDIAALLVNGKDLDGQWRIAGSHVDIGADEADGTAWTVAPVILRVDASSGDDSRDGASWTTSKRTIQAAMDSLGGSGGEVWVARGIYPEPITMRPFASLYGGFSGTETGRSARTPMAQPSLLGGDANLDAVSFSGGNTANVVDGFTIAKAYRGIVCADSSPTISRNVLTGNSVAIDLSNGSPILSSNTVRANFSGIQLDGGAATIANCVIAQQTSGGVACYGGSVAVRDSSIVGNGGTAVYIANGSASIIGNTIMGAETGIASLTGANVAATNNIVADNMTGILASASTQATITLKSNDIFGNYTAVSGLADPTGTAGNIAIDPMFASASLGDVHLQPGSGAIGAGDPSVVLPGDVDMDGSPRVVDGKVDIGADQADGQSRTVTPRIVRVNGTLGSDANDGTAWATAKQTIQAGIDTATTTGGEVWVGPGNYPEPINIRPFVYLYGGFNGTESSREEHPPLAGGTVLDGTGLPTTVKLRGGYMFTTLSGVTVTNSFLGISTIGNAATLSNNRLVGSGISETGGAPAITGSVFTATSPYASNVFVTTQSSKAAITRNVLTGAGSTGIAIYGAITINDGAPTVANNVLLANPIGLYISGAPTVANNTIVGNKYGVFIAGATGSTGSTYTSTLANNVISANTTAGVFKSGTMAVVLRNNDVFGPIRYSGIAEATGSNGNIAVNPTFAYPGDYRLGAGSPCIDTGDDTFAPAGGLDLDGKARILGAHVDMGAYEYSVSTLTLADAVRALKIAGGVVNAAAEDVARLDISPRGGVDHRVSMSDAVAVLRHAEGLDQ